MLRPRASFLHPASAFNQKLALSIQEAFRISSNALFAASCSASTVIDAETDRIIKEAVGIYPMVPEQSIFKCIKSIVMTSKYR